MKTYIFTFYSHPRYWRGQSVTRRYRNVAEAHQFVDGLRRGGAWDVKFQEQE